MTRYAYVIGEGEALPVSSASLKDAMGALVASFGFDAVKGALADVCKANVAQCYEVRDGTPKGLRVAEVMACKWERLADRLAAIPSEGM